jgi:hypothetical protein
LRLHLFEQLGEFLLALFLVEALIGFGNSRCIHRAEFRPAHGTEFRLVVEIVRERLIVHLATVSGSSDAAARFSIHAKATLSFVEWRAINEMTPPAGANTPTQTPF